MTAETTPTWEELRAENERLRGLRHIATWTRFDAETLRLLTKQALEAAND